MNNFQKFNFLVWFGLLTKNIKYFFFNYRKYKTLILDSFFPIFGASNNYFIHILDNVNEKLF